jgi:hypothetical protein
VSCRVVSWRVVAWSCVWWGRWIEVPQDLLLVEVVQAIEELLEVGLDVLLLQPDALVEYQARQVVLGVLKHHEDGPSLLIVVPSL